MNISDYARSLLYICVWREARGTPEAQQAVTWVILNRATERVLTRNIDLDEAIVEVIVAPWQFSSMTATGDPNLIKWPVHSIDFSNVADNVDTVLATHDDDPTGGATFYFSYPLTEPPAAWGKVVKTGQFGTIQTYKAEA